MIDGRLQEQVKHCNFCGSSDQRVLHHFPAGFYSHKAYTTYPWDGRQEVDLTIVKCKKCNLVFQNPRFKAEHLGLLYTDSVEQKLDIEKAVANHKFAPLIDLITQHCQFKNAAKPISFDIGTRYGLLPEVLRRVGFNAYGIEYNPLCVETSVRSGFQNVHQGTIDNLEEVLQNTGVSNINLVTMTDVIEHLLDPLADLKKLSSFQSSGDYMVIQTVDVGSVGYRIFKSWWYHLHGQHTYYFDINTMKAYFEKMGYVIDAVLKVGKLNNLTLLPSVMKKFSFHKKQRLELNRGGELEKKIWFAETRPTLFDIFTVVARKQ